MRAILFAIGLLCLPMLACTVPAEVAEVLGELGLQAEILLNVEEDGSGVMEIGLGSALKDDEGEYVLDCTDIDASDLPPGGSVDASMRGDMRWCQITAPFPDLANLEEMMADEEEEDSGLTFQCLVLKDGVFYFDMPTEDPAATDEEVIPIPIPFEVTAPGPVDTHNAAEVRGNTYIWNLATAPSHLLINLEEGDPCPGQGITLVINVSDDGSSQATLTVPLPPALDIYHCRQCAADADQRGSGRRVSAANRAKARLLSARAALIRVASRLRWHACPAWREAAPASPCASTMPTRRPCATKST